MRDRIITFLVGVFPFLTGCTSYVVFPKHIRGMTVPENPPEAYIINPELEREYKILEISGLFSISDNRSVEISITLEPMKTDIWPCGNPRLYSAMLLGIIPAYLPDKYYYNFIEERPDTVIHHQFELKVAERFSLWDIFLINPGKDRRLGEALRGEYLTKNYSNLQP